MKFCTPAALAMVVSASLLSGFFAAPAGAQLTGVEDFGYESIFDDWHEIPLATLRVEGRGEPPAIDAASRHLYAEVAKSVGEEPDAFIDETWAGNGFNELVDAIEREYPDLYVSASRADPDISTSNYDLVFAQAPPAELLERVRALPAVVDIRYGAPLSRKQLLELRSTIVGRFAADLLVAVDLSPLGTSVRVRYLPRDGVENPVRPGEIVQETERAVDAMVTSEGKRPNLDFQLDDTLKSDLTFQDVMAGYGYSGCTSGFAATLNGTPGLLTAKHCADRPYYAGSGIQMGQAVNASPQIDIQFNSVPSPHTAIRRFRIDVAGTTKTVTGVADPVYGDFVEKYGTATGYSWGYVTNADTCNTASGHCHLFKVNMNGNEGDSGGPCVSGQAARGVVQGGVPNSYTYCTKISYSPATVLQW